MVKWLCRPLCCMPRFRGVGISPTAMDEQRVQVYTRGIVTEHVHLDCSKRVDKGLFQIRMVAQRRFADAEVAVERSMGYDVEARYCGDPLCLGADPDPRDVLLREDYDPHRKRR